MDKSEFSHEQLVEINQRANELGKALDQFALDLRHKYHFYPDLTVHACATALGNMININMLVYNLCPELAPPYLQGTDYSVVVEKIKQEKQEFDNEIARYEQKQAAKPL
ncbi:hypothetical protein [Snodgrassella communis]|uniref:hypothetical protein n=1 Tax=Snodgrassella communis TaxID=2946699 RepID=UPI0005626E93|nr:hypothetical protein [Snodgrassella communis]